MQGDHTIKAIRLAAPDSIDLARLPFPQPKVGEILVLTAYLGIYGIDLHLRHGQSFHRGHGLPTFPFAFGHEHTNAVVAGEA